MLVIFVKVVGGVDKKGVPRQFGNSFALMAKKPTKQEIL
jgi:hypothetical protein